MKATASRSEHALETYRHLITTPERSRNSNRILVRYVASRPGNPQGAIKGLKECYPHAYGPADMVPSIPDTKVNVGNGTSKQGTMYIVNSIRFLQF
jgi:hypothetical protein